MLSVIQSLEMKLPKVSGKCNIRRRGVSQYVMRVKALIHVPGMRIKWSLKETFYVCLCGVYQLEPC